MNNIKVWHKICSKNFFKGVLIALLSVLMLAGLLVYFQPNDVKAAIQASKVLIISNDDTYRASGISGGTSVTAMANALTSAGFTVDTWIESSKNSAPPTVAYANQYDLVIFTQGVGYRNTNNGKQGLNSSDLNFLKQYLNVNSSGNKGRLILEGEDIMSDILRVGRSNDQRDLLKIVTSSSASNYGRMTDLRITDTGHPIYNYIYNLTGTTDVTLNNQTAYQDYIAPNLTAGARSVATAKFSGKANYFGSINTWSNTYGNRLVFMPFSWYVNSSNGISDTYSDWRNKLLVNMAAWVGERKINISGYDIADATTAPGDLDSMLAFTLSPALTPTSVTSPAVKGIKVTYLGDMSVAETSTVTVMVYADTGTIGSLEAGDKLLGTGVFSGGVANVDFNTVTYEDECTINATKQYIIAYKFATDAPIGKTAGARINSSSDLIMHDSDKLSRGYLGNPIDSVQTTLSAGGTASIKYPNEGSTISGNLTFRGTSSTQYSLMWSSGYNNAAGPWTQFGSGAVAVKNGSLFTWNTTTVTDGPYTVKLRAYSGAENLVSIFIDNTAPAISEVAHSGVKGNTATITWKTDEPSTSEVVYRISPSGVWESAGDSVKVTNHSVTLKSLSSNTFYDYKVKSTDAAGNSSESVGTQSFQTQDQGPFAAITSPAVIGQVTPRVGSFAKIKGSAYTVNAGHSVNWSLYYGYGTETEKVTTWKLITSSTTPVDNGVLTDWTTPTPDGAYILKLRVEDPALSGDSAFMETFVPVIVDNSKPDIQRVTLDEVNNTMAHIHWETSKLTVDKVAYGWDPGVYNYVIDDVDGHQEMCLYDLTPNKKYYFKIISTDNMGLVAETQEYSFTTTNEASDGVPPDISNVKLTAAGRTDSTAEMKWNEGTDNSGIAYYKIYYSLDGENFTQRNAIHSSRRTYLDRGLFPFTDYWYYVVAVDRSGLHSAPSNIVKITTTKEGHENPHGAYSTYTVMCSKCHATHRGKKEFLFNNTQEASMCYTCHDAAGTGSKYNIEAEYDPNHQSRHPLPMEHTGKECASCHNPHLNPATFPRLLKSTNTVTGSVYNSTNGFCYNCHGVNGPDRILENTAGAHDVFEKSVHNSVYFPDPESGTKIKCVSCHDNHSSDNVRLTKAPEEENCFQCHGDTSDKYGIPNVKRNLYRRSYHNVNGTASTGNVECVNCHNPHYVESHNRNVSDPYNTINLWNGDRTTFCLRCHDGDDPPVKQVDRTTNVPYTVNFPSVPLNLTTADSSLPNGGYNKTMFIDPLSVHYNNSTNRVQCTQCHYPHGSDNNRVLARDEDSTSSAEEGICVNCHSDSGEWKDLYPTTPAIFLEMTNASAHPSLTIDATTKHSDTEDYSTISVGDRHAECQDCHDPHSARKTGTKAGNVSGPLYNVSGVERSGGSLVFKSKVTEDWQVCYKCHSSYWPNLVSSGRRDIAAEFYRTSGTYSYHYVELQSNPNVSTTTASRITPGSKDHNGNTWTNTSKMYCQDCHGTPEGMGAKGVHGSVYDGILKGTYYTFTENSRAATDDRLICFQCHQRTYYEGTHMNNRSDHMDAPCWGCHGSVVHGSNRAHLLRVRNTTVAVDSPDYEAKSMLTSGTSAHPATSSKSSCSTNCGGH